MGIKRDEDLTAISRKRLKSLPEKFGRAGIFGNSIHVFPQLPKAVEAFSRRCRQADGSTFLQPALDGPTEFLLRNPLGGRSCHLDIVEQDALSSSVEILILPAAQCPEECTQAKAAEKQCDRDKEGKVGHAVTAASAAPKFSVVAATMRMWFGDRASPDRSMVASVFSSPSPPPEKADATVPPSKADHMTKERGDARFPPKTRRASLASEVDCRIFRESATE